MDRDRRRLKVKSSAENLKINHKWTVIVTVLAFVLSVAFSVLTASAEEMGTVLAFIVLMLIVILSILFDMIGMAISTASEAPFHAMATRRIKGAKESIKIIRNAQQLSSLCNDVIGDIAGIISGAMTGAIVVGLSVMLHMNHDLLNLLLAGVVAALMIGGKAAGKGVAMMNNNTIVFILGKIVYYVCVPFQRKKQ
ncbi:MAG: hypothetical protein IJD83_06250 [Clostridia bacterium]|nr:hypothetical protein [Clostridia bacterium]